MRTKTVKVRGRAYLAELDNLGRIWVGLPSWHYRFRYTYALSYVAGLLYDHPCAYL